MRPVIQTLIIGGTAAYGLDLSPWHPLEDPFQVQTPYGESPVISLLQPEGASSPVAFCSRHGRNALTRSAAFLNHRAIIWAAHRLGVTTIFSWNGVGVYVCTEGPRLETEAEIELYRRAGAEIVGMTLSPEVFLAQEAGIRYASLCYITNFATGRALGRWPKREFGPKVAQTCLPILLAAANRLND